MLGWRDALAFIAGAFPREIRVAVSRESQQGLSGFTLSDYSYERWLNFYRTQVRYANGTQLKCEVQAADNQLRSVR